MHSASVTVAQLPNASKIAKVAENYSLQKMLVRLKIWPHYVRKLLK